MPAVVGFAFLWLTVTPVGKRVFLRVVAATPQRHALHDDNSRHGSKSGLWPFKKSAVGGKKTADCKPLPNPPQGAGIHSRCALGGYDCAPFLEKDWNMNIIWAFFLPRGEG